MLPLIPLVGGIVAALCALAIIPWILGVPGNPDSQSAYVRGWKMGLDVIMVYPCAWALNFLPYFALRGLLSASNQAKWHEISLWIGTVALAAALVRMTWAIAILSKSG